MMNLNYENVTEIPGHRATEEQHQRLYHRYLFARQYAAGKDVLEVACGAGMGLGLLKNAARNVVGGDFTESLLKIARKHYQETIPLIRLDGHCLPFSSAVFDLVLLYEAVYYLQDFQLFLREAKRILRPGGVLLICSVNPDWDEFNPSPLSVKYYNAAEFLDFLREAGFQGEVHGAFPLIKKGKSPDWIAAARKIAVKYHLIPGSMKSKEILKRLFYGKLKPIEPEISFRGPSPFGTLKLNPEMKGKMDYKILYAVGHV